MTQMTEDPKPRDYISPTFGPLSLDGVFSKLVEYVSEAPDDKYNLIIGSDSFPACEETVFVSALVLHRIGHGGRYFYKRLRKKKIINVRQRIFYEATMSIELATLMRERLSENGFSRLPVEIHLDVGTNGDTKEIIKEVVSMVTGSGYTAVTKPDSYGATKVADRHSK